MTYQSYDFNKKYRCIKMRLFTARYIYDKISHVL